MSKYILLLNWTEQGVKAIKESANRYDAGKELAKSLGGAMESIHMTMGAYDLVCVVEAPTDEAMATLILRLAKGGAIRSTTLKAFPEAEYRKIIAAV